MNDEGRPSRFENPNPNSRLSDDFSDIFEAEYRHDDRPLREVHDKTAYEAYDQIRHGYDESQSLEVVSSEAQWLFGERFYAVREPAFEEDEFFIQDFGFVPAVRTSRVEIFWCSIVEDEPEAPKHLSDILGPDFFLPGHKKASQGTAPDTAVLAVGAVVLAAIISKDGGA